MITRFRFIDDTSSRQIISTLGWTDAANNKDHGRPTLVAKRDA
jgi:hypothetical protein